MIVDKNKLGLAPVAAATNDDRPGYFPKIDRVEHSAGPYYRIVYDSNIVLPCRNLSMLQNLIRILAA